MSLKCSAISNPIAIISWYVDGNLLLFPPNDKHPGHSYYNNEQNHQGPWIESTNNHPYSSGSYIHMNEIVSHVNISNIRVQDSGEWKCVASNLLSSVSHSARLNIYGK